MSALSCERLHFAYGVRPVLRGVSLAIESGEIVGLVGPNGSGKTTLLRCLAALLQASGEIRYAGVLLETLSPRARAQQRAYVPQTVSVVFPYRVCDVVAMGLAHRSRFYGASQCGECVERALEEVGFEPPPTQRFDRLSGGERQQVIVARAFVQTAGLLLLDEPTSALDLKHRAAVVAALKRHTRSGAAVLLSLHDLNLAALVCDRLLLLSAGDVVAQGRPSEVLGRDILERTYGVPVVCGSDSSGAPTVQLDPRAWV
ncbi:ABC transporter ATP-binding protein [Myxococcota bacterium]